MRFSDLGLSPSMLRAVKAQGYTTPTPIQAKTIPIALAGRDLIGLAETGSGKTASFLLPIIQGLEGGEGLRACIIVPTRELALQVEKVAHELSAGTGLRTISVIGGVRMTSQLSKLKKGVDILVATPGRLLDHLRSGTIWLDEVSYLVLDEADRLLDMGFLPDVKRIIKRIPTNRLSMLFSATLTAEVEGLVYNFLRDPEMVQVGRRSTPVEKVEQVAYSVMSHHKLPLLLRLAEEHLDGRALVFTRTKRGADKLSRVLKTHGHSVATMHADRSQSQRVSALEHFRDGKVRFLVATDIAARGIDIDDIAFVVNYDIPATVEDYVHRIGRTARAGRRGTAVTLVAPPEEMALDAFAKNTGQPITRARLDNFSDSYTAGPSNGALAAVMAAPSSASQATAGARGSFRSRPRRRRR